ncbi:MAG: periplasmic heavy metal sensor [Elusimicrobia bacterium]|nr:periplasmic heavy metal sensor [Elusimicrobiota bacterium]
MKKIISLVLTLFISSFIYAAPADPMHKQQDQLRQDFDKISKELNITDDQKQKINELMQADITKKRELRQQIRQKSNAIDEELMKEKPDMKKINDVSTEIQKLNAEIAKINIESKLNVRNILTYDQYSRMEKARKQLMEKFKQEREKK